MYKCMLAAAVMGFLAWSSPAQAQVIYYDAYRPVTSYYAPAAPVVAYSPVDTSGWTYSYSPVTSYPVTSYYAPAAAYPVTAYSPAPTYSYSYSPVTYPATTYYAPYTTYYAPAPVYYAPYYVPGQPVRNVLRSVFGPF